MGNKILIILIVSLTIFTGIISTFRKSTNLLDRKNVEYFESLQAKYIANSGMQLVLNLLNKNKTLRGNFSNNPLLGGKYDFSISGEDTCSIVIQSFYGNSNYKMKVNAVWENISFPKINSSLGIYSTNLSLKLNGNILINGNDVSPNGLPGTAPPVFGISVENIQDSIRIVSNIPSHIAPQIIGKGPIPSVGVVQNENNLNELINQYILSADLVLPSGTYSSGTTLGTLNDPKITYITGDATFAGNASGAGILVVYGDMSCSGNFAFYGLVIVYGNTLISASASGNSAIYGSMLVVGPSVNISATGSAIINYSSSSLLQIAQKLKSSRFFITSWFE